MNQAKLEQKMADLTAGGVRESRISVEKPTTVAALEAEVSYCTVSPMRDVHHGGTRYLLYIDPCHPPGRFKPRKAKLIIEGFCILCRCRQAAVLEGFHGRLLDFLHANLLP